MNNQNCPLCHAAIVDGKSFDIEDGKVMQEVYCENGHEWTDVYTLTEQRIEVNTEALKIEALETALKTISKWFGEFPETHHFYSDGKQLSYSAAYGSNGERDYMRKVAKDALEVIHASN